MLPRLAAGIVLGRGLAARAAAGGAAKKAATGVAVDAVAKKAMGGAKSMATGGGMMIVNNMTSGGGAVGAARGGGGGSTMAGGGGYGGGASPSKGADAASAMISVLQKINMGIQQLVWYQKDQAAKGYESARAALGGGGSGAKGGGKKESGVTFENMKNKGLEAVRELGKFAVFLSMVMFVWGAIKKAFELLVDAIDKYIVEPITKYTITGFKWVKEKLLLMFDYLFGPAEGPDTLAYDVVQLYHTVKEWIVGKFNWAKEGIVKGWTDLTAFVKEKWGLIVDWFTAKWIWAKEGIVKGWSDLTTYVKEKWGLIVDWFEGKWVWAKDLIVTGWTDLTTFVTTKWNEVVAWFEGKWVWAKDLIVTGWTDLTTYVSGKWDEVVKWFTGKWEWASDKVLGGWTSITAYVQGKWDSITKWFTGKWEGLTKWFDEFDPMADIKEKFGDLGTLIAGVAKQGWDWIKGLFTFGDKEEKGEMDPGAEVSSMSDKLGKIFKDIGGGIIDAGKWIDDQAAMIMKKVADPFRKWAASIGDSLLFTSWFGDIDFGGPIKDTFNGLADMLDPKGAQVGDTGMTVREMEGMEGGGPEVPSGAGMNLTNVESATEKMAKKVSETQIDEYAGVGNQIQTMVDAKTIETTQNKQDITNINETQGGDLLLAGQTLGSGFQK